MRNASPAPPFSKLRSVLPPQPAPQEEKKPGIFGKVLAAFNSKEAELRKREQKIEAEKAQAERDRAEIRRIADELGELTSVRDEAAGRLKLADQQFAGLKADKESLRELHRTRAWGVPIVQGRTVDAHYARMVFIDAAIADFPECRKPLAATLKVAEDELDAFRKRHSLGPEAD